MGPGRHNFPKLHRGLISIFLSFPHTNKFNDQNPEKKTTTTATTRIEEIQPLSTSPKQMTTKIHPQSLTAFIPEHGWLEEDPASF